LEKSVEGRPLDEKDLVERARRGDVDAYEQLVRHYQGVAQRVAYVVTRDDSEAQDAAQEAFVKAFYALGRFREGGSFRPWLLKIVTNEARNRRRSAGRREGLGLRAVGERPSEDAAPSSEVVALEHERTSSLLRAVDSLSEKDRLVVSYRFFFDLSEAEMSEALGIHRGTVKSRLSRALGRLRHLVEEEPVHE
jgi:RNA polymerase sigma factor (sigma-70 family)